MSIATLKIALITFNEHIAVDVKDALKGLFIIEVFPNGTALQYAMVDKHHYKAIIADDELFGENGLKLQKKLDRFGFKDLPFIVLIDEINDKHRRLAMKENIAELFSKPIDKNALRIRVPYLAKNYNIKNTKLNDTKPYKLPLIKRIFDISFSGLALLVLSPILIVISIIIKLESKGPVFYYSLRVGSGYKVFKFFKFRSMFTGADAKLKDLAHLNQYNNAKIDTVTEVSTIKVICELCERAGTGCKNPLYADNNVVCETLYNQQKEKSTESAFIKIKNDPRITRIGNFIRNTSIDELPQLWNVFIGDMSIVGNRPLPIYEADKITTDKYAPRFIAPAGITGLWQVEKRGASEMSEEERLNLDNNYAKTHSFNNDIRLILRTIPALFQSENV